MLSTGLASLRTGRAGGASRTPQIKATTSTEANPTGNKIRQSAQYLPRKRRLVVRPVLDTAGGTSIGILALVDHVTA